MNDTRKIGWIGLGRMGVPMVEKVIKAGYEVAIWNRTRSKAEPLAQTGAIVVDRPLDLSGVDVLFTIVSTGSDLEQGQKGRFGLDADNGLLIQSVHVDRIKHAQQHLSPLPKLCTLPRQP